VLHLQEVVRGSLDVPSNLVTVSGAVKECSQNEHVKRALEDGRALLCLFRNRRDSTLDMVTIVDTRPSVVKRTQNRLHFFSECIPLRDQHPFAAFLRTLYRQDWVVYC
jgi:hypothetical protein